MLNFVNLPALDSTQWLFSMAPSRGELGSRPHLFAYLVRKFHALYGILVYAESATCSYFVSIVPISWILGGRMVDEADQHLQKLLKLFKQLPSEQKDELLNIAQARVDLLRKEDISEAPIGWGERC